MFEVSNTTSQYPLDTPDVEHERDRLEEERRRDVELSADRAEKEVHGRAKYEIDRRVVG